MIRGVLLKTVEKISLRRVAMNLSKNFQMVQALFFFVHGSAGNHNECGK